ncbi:unnamed protein product [Mytilus edulis]|uniref:Tc1-like transposase DDE domain-containing protein n=1 Tax=Mytilus edulis TaxID=6550 RepID=A0A8S3RGW8_MYTED|nr:unnamed protein product [Mytilus edulis]
MKRKYSLMIWGCITYHGVGTITVVEGNINALKYIDIIDNNLWPVVVRHFPDNNYVFQDDNAPVHRARSVQDFRRETGLKSMNWPAQSPDLNIIENCWWVLKRELQKRTQNINNTKDLEREIRDIWDKLTVTYLKSLYNSIPRRIEKECFDFVTCSIVPSFFIVPTTAGNTAVGLSSPAKPALQKYDPLSTTTVDILFD